MSQRGRCAALTFAPGHAMAPTMLVGSLALAFLATSGALCPMMTKQRLRGGGYYDPATTSQPPPSWHPPVPPPAKAGPSAAAYAAALTAVGETVILRTSPLNPY